MRHETCVCGVLYFFTFFIQTCSCVSVFRIFFTFSIQTYPCMSVFRIFFTFSIQTYPCMSVFRIFFTFSIQTCSCVSVSRISKYTIPTTAAATYYDYMKLFDSCFIYQNILYLLLLLLRRLLLILVFIYQNILCLLLLRLLRLYETRSMVFCSSSHFSYIKIYLAYYYCYYDYMKKCIYDVLYFFTFLHTAYYKSF